ncbi:hypothetical protein [Bernardetia sp.]|uniref:hypothetical protein n=1 Tax=Bernardetia sp. TaxID=1937974 RepID=UPI0025BA68C8|nr:hypothetical protein [Bernardetia sp.]
MKKIILSLLLILSFSYAALGQIVVKGRIIDNSGEPIIGSMIKLEDTLRGTFTDINGRFEIEVENENSILIFVRHEREPLKLKASEINGDIFLYSELNKLICRVVGVPIQRYLFEVNYWSGVFYNPYGIKICKNWYLNKKRDNEKYISSEIAYSTNFEDNQDFYGKVGTEIFKRPINYSFQNTIFNKSDTQNNIQTHLLESGSDIKLVVLLYGIGHQTFLKEGVENSRVENYGIQLGLSKYFQKISLYCSVRSFYWQNYWAWEANLNRKFFYRKLRLNTGVSYRQIAQDFKEINLTLGYIF